MEEYLEMMLIIGRSVHTHRRHQSALRCFILWCTQQNINKLKEISKNTLRHYRKYLYNYRQPDGKHLTNGSKNSKLTPIKVFFNWCAKEHYLPFDIAHDFEIPHKPRGIPTKILMHDAIELILKQPDIKTTEGLRDRTMMEVLYSTAIRRSEVTNLMCRDIDLERRTVKVSKSKNGWDRFVPIGERALNWIEQYLEIARPNLLKDQDDGRLFLSRQGIAFKPDALAARVKSYIKLAEIDTRGSCHLFRHSVATQMLENGADIRYIQALLGHVDLNTTEIYTRVAIKKLKEVHARTHPTTVSHLTNR